MSIWPSRILFASRRSATRVTLPEKSSDPVRFTYQSSDPEGYTYQSSDPEGCTYQSRDPKGHHAFKARCEPLEVDEHERLAFEGMSAAGFSRMTSEEAAANWRASSDDTRGTQQRRQRMKVANGDVRPKASAEGERKRSRMEERLNCT
ncbi:NBS-LRR type resistance protein [Cucumis melo var. makuwa]|uniref:NBS-LRR type resistance protein n=1 Tax=Cucumis melo var. makuwa TaxID=1194695 RepID=A0A5D3CXR3_CUCMM|nr:NBS-LRR type resistance protein [Cucumis melo var. makuwa]